MSTSVHFDRLARICIIVAIVLSLVLMVLVSNGSIEVESSASYQNLIFDKSRVHTIDIEINDWNAFVDGCEDEEYTICDITIDGKTISDVGLRAKGNTSLSSVTNGRYSLKVEFDHFQDGLTYYGLDKLCLNNIIQDNTYMKDYLSYTLMIKMGVASPLCSYAYITVNGKDWGLYLAVESIEDGFIQRNYGNTNGQLYKPDSLSMGGGRGNGKGFDMDNFNQNFNINDMSDISDITDFNPSDNPFGIMPGGFSQSEGTTPSFNISENIMNSFGMGNFGGTSSGSSDVKLQYIDDNISSYSNIFDNAKTAVTSADKNRLIRSLKTLSNYVNGEDADISSVVDVESVIKYFVVHNFTCNGDSYTGTMIHNYYLYEQDGVLSMIPWDYNLAYGGFNSDNATSEVNSDIYNPSSSTLESLPMLAWIFQDEEYTELYEFYYQQFLKIDISAIIEETYKMITPYVQNDTTAFCTYDEFIKGKETLSEFCKLRCEAISRQLNGDSSQVDASSINLSDMGSMGNMSQGNAFDVNEFGGKGNGSQTNNGNPFSNFPNGDNFSNKKDETNDDSKGNR